MLGHWPRALAAHLSVGRDEQPGLSLAQRDELRRKAANLDASMGMINDRASCIARVLGLLGSAAIMVAGYLAEPTVAETAARPSKHDHHASRRSQANASPRAIAARKRPAVRNPELPKCIAHNLDSASFA
jgi:hypothetical protein